MLNMYMEFFEIEKSVVIYMFLSIGKVFRCFVLKIEYFFLGFLCLLSGLLFVFYIQGVLKNFVYN